MNKHLFLPSNYITPELYTPQGTPIKKQPRSVDSAHGQRLKNEYETAIQQTSMYIDITVTNDGLSNLKSLEQSGHVRIANVHGLDNDYAKVTINKYERYNLLKKINEYINELTKTGKPKNEPLIVNMQEIKTATLASFWMPEEYQAIADDQAHWAEIWLTTKESEKLLSFKNTAARLGITVKEGQLQFPDTTIMLIKAGINQFEQLISQLDFIGEFRQAPLAISQYLNLSNFEQVEYVRELLDRCTFEDSNLSVCILDNGITAGHPLLDSVLSINDIYSLFDNTSDGDCHVTVAGHGTAVAGLVVYGDLAEQFKHSNEVHVPYHIESVKLIDSRNPHEPELYGEKTKQATYRPVISNPDKERIYFSTITAADYSRGKPSSWSAAIDQLSSEETNRKLFIISAGNEQPIVSGYVYPESNMTKQIENPAQAWNAVTVGAYTEKTAIVRHGYENYLPVAPAGGLSPFSPTSATWSDKKWPVKPDILMEGGNIAQLNGDNADIDDLQLLTANHQYAQSLLRECNGTSAAAALAARYAATIKAEYPDAWPETVRALLIHSATWTPAMNVHNLQKKGEITQAMKLYGYGVPDLNRALYDINSSLTLIAQNMIQPYTRESSKSPKCHKMDIYELPWPKDVLESLGDTTVEMRVTLSYFIEPSPREIWNTQYQYQSFGLRFDVNSPTEDLDSFKLRISKHLDEDGKAIKSETASSGKWFIGDSNDKGSVHSDYWHGTAAELAASNLIAVYPVSGWWKTLVSQEKFNNECRYSLIISIHTNKNEIDIYTPIKNEIDTIISIPIGTEPNT